VLMPKINTRWIFFFKVIYFHVFSHLAMRQVQDAANLLARRYNQSSLRTSSHVCLIAKDKQQGLTIIFIWLSKFEGIFTSLIQFLLDLGLWVMVFGYLPVDVCLLWGSYRPPSIDTVISIAEQLSGHKLNPAVYLWL
jgi:hypothetical protein